jgi:hypothetical protein
MELAFGRLIPQNKLRAWMPGELDKLLMRLKHELGPLRATAAKLACAWSDRTGFLTLTEENFGSRSLGALARDKPLSAPSPTPTQPAAAAASGSGFYANRTLCLEPRITGRPLTCQEGWCRIVFDYLYHAFKVATTMVTLIRQHGTSPERIMADSTFTSLSCSQTRAFVLQGASGHLEGDRLIGLRRCGPSMTLMLQHWSGERARQHLRHFLHHLLVARVWAWGKLDAMQGLCQLEPGPQPVADLFQQLGEAHFQRVKRCRNRLSYFCMVQAYGQAARRPEELFPWLERSWSVADALTKKLQSGARPDCFLEFEELLLQEVDKQSLPYISRHSLLAWLICCDLSEWDLIPPPTSGDLVGRLMHGSGTGPQQAFQQMAIERSMQDIRWDAMVLQWLMEQVLEGLTTALDYPCQRFQQRSFNAADAEHLLCKITREWKARVPREFRDAYNLQQQNGKHAEPSDCLLARLS